MSPLGIATEPVERLQRASLLLLNGGVLLRLDRLAAHRDGGGDGDGLLHLDHGGGLLARHPFLLGGSRNRASEKSKRGERVTKSKRDDPSREPKSKLVASGATRELIESMRDRRRARCGVCPPHGHRDVGEEKHYDDELRVPDGHVEGPARRRNQAASALVEGPAQIVDDAVGALTVHLHAREDGHGTSDDCESLGVGL